MHQFPRQPEVRGPVGIIRVAIFITADTRLERLTTAMTIITKCSECDVRNNKVYPFTNSATDYVDRTDPTGNTVCSPTGSCIVSGNPAGCNNRARLPCLKEEEGTSGCE